MDGELTWTGCGHWILLDVADYIWAGRCGRRPTVEGSSGSPVEPDDMRSLQYDCDSAAFGEGEAPLRPAWTW